MHTTNFCSTSLETFSSFPVQSRFRSERIRHIKYSDLLRDIVSTIKMHFEMLLSIEPINTHHSATVTQHRFLGNSDYIWNVQDIWCCWKTKERMVSFHGGRFFWKRHSKLVKWQDECLNLNGECVEKESTVVVFKYQMCIIKYLFVSHWSPKEHFLFRITLINMLSLLWVENWNWSVSYVKLQSAGEMQHTD